jgi:beta-glucosidase
MEFDIKDLGPDFLWGVTTAAYQIEGGFQKDGKGLSIWDEFSNARNGKKIKDKSNANISCNHYHLWKEDLDLLQLLQIPNYRFSLSWSRILPNGTGKINPKGLDFYDKLCDQLLKRNITPWATLYHWDLPLELHKKGGWKNRDVLNWFEEYAHKVSLNLGDRIKNWIVLNEPMVFSGAGYFLGYHAPGEKGLKNFAPVMLHVALSQKIGHSVLRVNVKNANIGTTISCSHIEAIDNKEKNILAAKRMDALLNRLYFEPLIGLGFPTKELESLKIVEKHFQPNDEKNLVVDFDFIGIQNYTREVIAHSWLIPYIKAKIIPAHKRNVDFSTMGWEIYPESIYQVLKKFDAYKKVNKFIVTESGIAVNDTLIDNKIIDKQRINYFKEAIKNVIKAKNEGVNIDGYFVWTLLDNFEWAEGYTQRFGLVYSDFDTQKRIIKDSGFWYSELIKSHKNEFLPLISH